MDMLGCKRAAWAAGRWIIVDRWSCRLDLDLWRSAAQRAATSNDNDNGGRASAILGSTPTVWTGPASSMARRPSAPTPCTPRRPRPSRHLLVTGSPRRAANASSSSPSVPTRPRLPLSREEARGLCASKRNEMGDTHIYIQTHMDKVWTSFVNTSLSRTGQSRCCQQGN